jgi:hypothetical protein
VDPAGRPVIGTATPAPDGLSWAFVAQQPWVAGAYSIAVDPILEDVAGNSVQRVFDRDLSNPLDDPRSAAPTIPMEVK